VKIINDQPIEAEFVEYGVQFEDGEVVEMDMDEAFATVAFGLAERVLVHKVYETAWAEVSR
jgi:hypothetical protein